MQVSHVVNRPPNSTLLLTITANNKRTDILYCLQRGGSSLFYRDEMPKVRHILIDQGLCISPAEAAAAVRHTSLDPDLHDVLADIIMICTFFNNNLPTITLNFTLFLETHVSICYRLLRFHELETPWSPLDSIQAAYHTALTILMMSMFLHYDRRRVMDYGLITRHLWLALDGVPVGEQEDELNLWVMMMGGLWISADDHVILLAPKIMITAERLGICTWEDMLSSVTKFPWIHALHDEPGRELWKKICRSQKSCTAVRTSG